ncbi:AMMECR1 domain-containing protein [candidate division KSB1 bacterium]|nr:MAG: AMMECR1 domain-containing protein [candidate division KSB1 bacterium]
MNNKQNLSDKIKSDLIEIAKTSIEKSVKGEKLPDFKFDEPVMNEKRGAFVTIKKSGKLRGCIGYVLPLFPLYETVLKAAKAAALEDPRFPSVSKNELKDLKIEISVLTPMKEIEDVNEIEVGKHGIMIKKGPYQGLLLPQVATEYNWDRKTFLEHTCLKAGLDMNAWRDKDTTILIFSAEVFEE